MLFNDPGVHSTDAIEESVDHFASLTRLSLLEGKIGYFLEEIAHRGA